MVHRREVIGSLLALGASPAAATCRARKTYVGGAPFTGLTAPMLEAARASGAPPDDAALDAAFGQAMERARPVAATAALARAEGPIWTRTQAAAGAQAERFYWASAGKAHTATAVLQLVEEGRLALDAPLSRWVPASPNARLITAEDLLAHTSGLFSFQADAALRARSGYKSPEEALAAAFAHPPEFCPGAAWSYSNTGYTLLGRIVELIEQRPFHEVVTARVVDRLGLTETTILAPRQSLAGMALPAPGPQASDGANDDVTTPWAAGPVAASAADMVRFWRGVFAGRLHSHEITSRRFARLYPMFGARVSFYGLGVTVTDLASASGQADLWLGHDGGLPGATATAGYSTARGAYFAVAFTGPGSPQATANLLLSATAT